MKTKLLAMVLLAGGSMFAQSRLSIGVGVGGYGPGYPPYAVPTPYAVQAVVPPCPGPDYNWVNGYWSPYGGRRTWVAGYWAPPVIGAYRGGYQVAPRFVEPAFGNRYGNAYRRGNVNRSFDRGHQYGRAYQNGFRGR